MSSIERGSQVILFFSNRLGCAASVLVSLLMTVAALALVGIL
jgi:hypothetical protein